MSLNKEYEAAFKDIAILKMHTAQLFNIEKITYRVHTK